jgi:hypothetical protein
LSSLHIVYLASQGQLLRSDVASEDGKTTGEVLTLFPEGFSDNLPRNSEVNPSISVLALNPGKYEIKKARPNYFLLSRIG